MTRKLYSFFDKIRRARARARLGDTCVREVMINVNHMMFPLISESSNHDDENVSPLSKRYEMIEKTPENLIASVFHERHRRQSYNCVTILFHFTLSTCVKRQSSWDIQIDLRQHFNLSP